MSYFYILKRQTCDAHERLLFMDVRKEAWAGGRWTLQMILLILDNLEGGPSISISLFCRAELESIVE